MTTSNSKRPEIQPTPYVPEEPESPATPIVATEARFWPVPPGCIDGDEQPEAEPHIFVGGVRVPPRKK
jgi:hypothetical protein